MPKIAARATLTLPAELLQRVDRAVQQGRARSRNAFVATAVERDLVRQERAAIDAEFARMAEDEDYLAESRRMQAELAGADAEAFRRVAQPGRDLAGHPRPQAAASGQLHLDR